ncbi:MAG: DUF494 domain-containing protein [Gammaproteobacteria bacterium]
MTTSANLFDVLMYLFDNYFEDELEVIADQEAIKRELAMVGFGENQIDRAFDWLEVVASQNAGSSLAESGVHHTQRIFNEQELDKLTTDCRGFILYLEQAGILDADAREMVIDRLMALEIDEIALYHLKWVVLMVLLNQPGREESFQWMESLVMDDELEAGLH